MTKRRTKTLAAAFLALLIATGSIILSGPAGTETEQGRVDRLNRKIEEKGLHWKAGITSVSGLTMEEKKALCGCLPLPASETAARSLIKAPEGAAYDSVFDWRTMDAVTPVKNQGACGSCWDFAAIAQLESHVKIYEGREEDFSEQQVLDCNTEGRGCDGGYAYNAYEIMMSYGSVREACYPYQRNDGFPCTEASCEPAAWISDYYYVGHCIDIDDIKEALLSGPVWARINIVDEFYSYDSGCFSWEGEIVGYHAVLIIGWDDGQCEGEGAWIIKNSWGPGWGEDGFGYVKYENNCIGASTSQIIYRLCDVFVDLMTPDGGEVLPVGEDFEIVWTTSRAVPDSISILLSLTSGDSYDYTIASGLSGTDTSWVWNALDIPSSTARIKVVAWYGAGVGGYDFSGSDFTIEGGSYRYVSTTGGDIFPYSTPSGAALSIQDAIDAADPGDTVRVEAGIYEENVVVLEEVYLMGGWNSGFTEQDPGESITTITSTGSPVSFTMVSGYGSGIEGFTITGGKGTAALLPVDGSYGGGIFSYESSPIIKENIISGCGYTTPTGFSGGGAIACYNGTVIISGNTIDDCTAQSGGGIYLYQASAVISGNTISNCRPDTEYSGSKNGGGIYALHSILDMSGNSIHDNDGYMEGGGIYARLSPVTSSGDSIFSNEASFNGGGIFGDHSSLSLSGSFVCDNRAATSGGGIYLKGQQLDIDNSIIAKNRTAAMAGGVYADSTWGAWTNNTFDRNTALYVGGNVLTMNAVAIDVRNNMITCGSPNGFQPSIDANITFQYNDCFGNTPLDVAVIVPDSTNISRHPHYCDTMLVDYQLSLHSGGIDTGDPSIIDIDGSRSDIGAFGGPGSSSLAPEYVQNLAASAINDTTIEITWDVRLPGGLDHYAIYADTFEQFIPDESNFLAALPPDSYSFQDSGIDSCMYYRVNIIDLNGYASGYSGVAGDCLVGATTDVVDFPSYVNDLEQNYPNPFNGSTTIRYSVASPARVVLKIYDTAGRLIRTLDDSQREAGLYVIRWDGRDNASRPVASGVYFIRLALDRSIRTRKIIYLR